jgi:hypothetical protein
MGRVRLHVALDFSAYSLETFIIDSIEPGSIIATDAWHSYNIIESNPYGHDKTNQSNIRNNEQLYGVHLITTLVKRLIRGTFHGRLEPKYLQNYLDEFTFRFNRRKSKSVGKKFMRIVQQVVNSAKVTCKELMWDMDPISEYYLT